ncbi:MAG: PEGA domain-containing protein [Polyangiaceae bacterium]
MGQGYDPRGGGGGYQLPKPTPPPRQNGHVAPPAAPHGTLRGGADAPRNAHAFQDDPTNQEPAAARLPPVKPPPRKIGSVPEMEVFSGFAPNAARGARGSGHPSSLPPVAPPPRRSPQNLAESVTNVRPQTPHRPDRGAPPDLGASESLEWSEEEESTQVYADGRSEPPPVDAHYVRAAAPPPSSSQMARSSRQPPRIVPPAPSRATLLGVSPESLGQRPLPQPSSPPQASSPPQPSSPPSSSYAPPPYEPIPDYDAAPSSASAQAVFPPPMPPGQLPLPPTRGPSLEFPSELSPAQPPAMPSIPQAQIPAGAMPTTSVSSDDLYQRYATVRPGRESANERPRRPMVSQAHIEPPQESSTGKMAIAIALVTALLTAAAAGAFFLLRRPGALEIEVKDPKGTSVTQLTVYVDGRKVCETTPCIVSNLDPGSKSIRVVAAGYADEEPKKAEISAGSTNKLAIVLKPSFGVLVASSEQPNLRISVDGTERGPLPARLTDLTAGDHQIRVFGGDRYKPLEKSIDVKIGEQIDLGAVKLEVVRGKMTVSLKSEGTSIVLIPNDDEKKAKALDGPFPRAVEVETNSGSWKLVAKKKGFPDFVAPLDFSDGVAEKTLEISMEKPTPPVPDIVATNEPDKDPPKPVASNDTPSTPAPTHTSDPKPVDTPAAPAPDDKAYLNINSIPVSRILLDGTPMGETPRSHVAVSPGTHTVTFVHSELGKKSVTVTVKAGETKTAGAKLRD